MPKLSTTINIFKFNPGEIVTYNLTKAPGFYNRRVRVVKQHWDHHKKYTEIFVEQLDNLKPIFNPNIPWDEDCFRKHDPKCPEYLKLDKPRK